MKILALLSERHKNMTSHLQKKKKSYIYIELFQTLPQLLFLIKS